MTKPSIKFNRTDKPDFVKVLHKKVNAYFREKNISKYANWNMKLKTLVMVTLYIAPLLLMLFGVVESFGWVLLMWFIMSVGMSGIGLSVMHDANHGAYSKNPTVNKFFGSFINFLGGNDKIWKIEHNYFHHTYTNVEGMDGDIDVPLMRFSKGQKPKFIYRFQAFYAPLLYAVMTLNWFISDFFIMFKMHKKRLLDKVGTTLWKGYIQVITNKLLHITVLIVLPLLLTDLPWWQIMIGYLMMQALSGLTLALIFTCAHVVEETDFYQPDEEGTVENSWAILQLRTTTNFANGAKLFSWYIGGLNYQIEHHLFPNICHIHYKNLSKIVRETAEEFNIPYHHHKTFLGALKSHFSHLHKLGNEGFQSNLKIG